MGGLDRNDAIALAACIGGPLVGGTLSGLAVAGRIKNWYKRLKKPKWNPPNWLFGAIWPVLYTSQGVASWLVWRVKGSERRVPLILYGVQLALNFAWSPLFFQAKRVDLALIDSAAMLGVASAATATMVHKTPDHRPAVSGLMAPYLTWIAYATALNFKIWRDNPKAHEIPHTDFDDLKKEVKDVAKPPAKTT